LKNGKDTLSIHSEFNQDEQQAKIINFQ